MSMYNNKNRKPTWISVIRIFIGLVFIFSSTVKGIDPVGTSYRVQDYLVALGWQGLMQYALTIAFLVIISEFILGIAFLFKAFMKIAIPGMFVMMVFFTVVTYFDAVNNWVPDCGCFGDAIKLTNWHTFYKNIVLILLSFLFIIKYKSFPWKKNSIKQLIIVLLLGGLFSGFVFHNYNHLPVIDFRNWKEGRSLKTTSKNREKVYVTYRNKKTGKTKEYLSPDYPWKDSVWMSQWEFVDQRIDDSQVVRKYDLAIEDSLGNDLTKEIVENPTFQFIAVSYYLSDASGKGMEKLVSIVQFLNKKKIPIVLLTASETSAIHKTLQKWPMNLPVYFADDIQLKALIRSNPGLVLMHDGTVIKKWHYHDFPSKMEIDKLIQ